MIRILYMILLCLATLACERRDLTYNYSPYCEVVVNIDWSNMKVPPKGISIRAYPKSGEKPIIIHSNTITGGTLKLPVGEYNILVFNQIPSDFGTVTFRGMEKWETAELYSNEQTTESWATDVAQATIVREPEYVAASTYTNLKISEKDTESYYREFKSTEDEKVTYTINLKPRVVVKKTFVRVHVDGIKNLRSTRGVLTGMTDGYNFSTQTSFKNKVSHILHDWKIEPFGFVDQYGETNTYFMSFGLPNVKTATRAVQNWDGHIDLEMLLVDNKTVIKHSADVSQYTEIKDDDDDVNINITIEVGVSGGDSGDDDDDDDNPTPILPDVKPEGGSSSGFDATIDNWEREERHEVDIN